jgi:hypothetical protein
MKFGNKYNAIIGLSILIGSACVLFFQLKEKNNPIIYKRPHTVQAQKHVNSMTFYEESDIYCGILLMPKSMLPTLKRFSNYDIARKIKIMPANIEWDDGQMLVIPKEAILKEINQKIVNMDTEDGSVKNLPLQEKNAEVNVKKLDPALLYFFLANASKNKIKY